MYQSNSCLVTQQRTYSYACNFLYHVCFPFIENQKLSMNTTINLIFGTQIRVAAALKNNQYFPTYNYNFFLKKVTKLDIVYSTTTN